jgi:hypothetical protein
MEMAYIRYLSHFQPLKGRKQKNPLEKGEF